MKRTIVMIPGVYPKASESIFRAIRESLAGSDYEIVVLNKANKTDLAAKAEKIESKILLGKSHGGSLAIEYQMKHGDAKALVLLAPGHKAETSFREIKIPVLIVHGTADRVIPIENSRELAKVFVNFKLVEIQGADHSYKGKEQEIAKVTSDWLNSLPS